MHLEAVWASCEVVMVGWFGRRAPSIGSLVLGKLMTVCVSVVCRTEELVCLAIASDGDEACWYSLKGSGPLCEDCDINAEWTGRAVVETACYGGPAARV